VRWNVALLVAMAGLLVVAPGASARNAYVANSGDGTVTVIDAATNAPVATVPVGGEPVDLAVTPDGKRVYVVDSVGESVTVLDTATNAQIGPPIPMGAKPRGIAITPDGLTAVISNSGDDTVTFLSTPANGQLGPPVAVGEEPEGIGITPDGRLAFVAQKGGGLSAIDIATRTVVGTVPDALGPSRIAIGPRGGRGFVTNSASNSVTAFNPAALTVVGAPITVGEQPAGIGIESSGTLAYAASPTDGTVTPFNTSLNVPIGGPLAFPGATGVALRPDGLAGYVTNAAGAVVSILDTTRNAAAGAIGVGASPVAVAFAPNQGPVASFWVSPSRRRAKRALTFHGGGSQDPDGGIVSYAWDFGDGRRVVGTTAMRSHRYRRPGTYLASLVVRDNEGCSTEVIFSGQTVSCNGSPAAGIVIPITVFPTQGPALRLAGPKRQRLKRVVVIRARCLRVACSLRARGFALSIRERRSGKVRRKLRLRPTRAPALSRGWRKLRLRVPGRTRRVLARTIRRGGKARARVTVVGRSESGDFSARSRKVKLALPRGRR